VKSQYLLLSLTWAIKKLSHEYLTILQKDYLFYDGDRLTPGSIFTILTEVSAIENNLYEKQLINDRLLALSLQNER